MSSRAITPRLNAIARPRSIAVLIVLAVALIPRIPGPVERNAGADIDMVRSTEWEYRGIKASFDELTDSYAVQVYAQPELMGWESQPNPHHPETGALVTARFAVAGLVSDDGGNTANQWQAPAHRLRAALGGELAVTWRLMSLGGFQVMPHGDYARDAVAVFRQTVDGLLDRMVYLVESADLRGSPSPQGPSVTALDAGTVLLQEGHEGSWVRVRVPSSSTSGWVQAKLVRRVDDQ